MTANYPLVDSVESFEKALAQVRAAQKTFATYTQEQVDHIFQAPVVMLLEVILPIRVGLLDMLLKLLQVILIRWMVIFIYIPVMLLVQ